MQILKHLVITLGILAISGLAHLAHAEPLTPRQVERFIAGMPELIALGEKHDDDTLRDIDPARPLSSSLEQMSNDSPAYVELAELASRHGFASAEQLSDVGDRSIQAYLFAKSGVSAQNAQAGYLQGVANINKDPALDAARKEMILTRMESTHKLNMEALKASEKDIPAVQPHMAALDKLLD